MKKLLWLLPLLVGCEHRKAEYRVTKQPQVTARIPTAPAGPDTAYTSGDRATAGPLDTLHIGSVVLRLVPGTKADFAPRPASPPSFSEARAIRREGGGRVQRVGHTLVVRPCNGPVLKFTDDTYQIREDGNEETDTHCQFSGSLPGRPYWLVDSLQWERYQPFLINKYSGRTTLLSWNPEISPNRQLLFVATPGLDIESSRNGLQLFTISDQSISLIWTRDIANWQPHRVRWLDNQTIAIEQLRFAPKEDTAYVRLLLPH